MPTQLAFGRDALLNISFEAGWQCIKKWKQHRIMQNDKAKNGRRCLPPTTPHRFQIPLSLFVTASTAQAMAAGAPAAWLAFQADVESALQLAGQANTSEH